LLVQRLDFALQRLRLAFDRFGFPLLRLRQPLLEVADPRAFVVPQALGHRELGSALGVHALASPTHWPLLDRATNRRQATPRGPRGQGGVAVFGESGECLPAATIPRPTPGAGPERQI